MGVDSVDFLFFFFFESELFKIGYVFFFFSCRGWFYLVLLGEGLFNFGFNVG